MRLIKGTLLVLGIVGCSSGAGSSGDGNLGPNGSTSPTTGLDPNGNATDPNALPPVATSPADSSAADPAFGRAALRRLTVFEYTNTIQALFGDQVAQGLDLEPDTQLNGLSAIATTEIALSARATEQFEATAYRVADAALANATLRTELVGCDPSQAGCLSTFVATFGERAWRRPLSSEEVTRYGSIGERVASDLQDPWQGVRYALAGLLQSPNFVYRVELGDVDPSSTARRPLSGYELASRLSYFLNGAPPDAPLLEAAAEGNLAANLATHVARLLSSPDAVRSVENFFGEYLQLYALSETVKDTQLFPEFTPTLRDAMGEQTRQTMALLGFSEDRDFRELLTTRQTFLNDELAALYGVELPNGEGFRPFTFDDGSPRAGLLSHASLMSVNGHVSSTSATLRGKFIREVLLCQGIPAPPPGVDITLPEFDDEIRTARQRLEMHATNATCAVCHSLMDPIGLGLENFDAIGRYREMENGVEIDASGLIKDISGTVGDQPFADASELAEVLKANPALPSCLTETLYRHASGGLASSAESPVLADLNAQFAASQYRFRSLLERTAENPAFGYVRALD